MKSKGIMKMNALQELRAKLFRVGGRGMTFLELAVLHAREITVAEHERAAAELAALQQERDELKFLLLRCQQINYTADGEGAGAWNINGEFEKEIDAALKGGKK
jgi:hypothetical protein